MEVKNILNLYHYSFFTLYFICSKFTLSVCVQVDHGADIVYRNKKQLLPVHCAAMQVNKEIMLANLKV